MIYEDMTIEELYDKLSSPTFKEPKDGDMFYNYFIFQYDAKKEYELRKNVEDIRDRLKRPTNYIDTLVINVWEEYLSYLNQKKFGPNPSYLKYLLEKEKGPRGVETVGRSLANNANNEQFYAYLHNKILRHIQEDTELKKPYVFFYGLGGIFPYLRVSTLLTNYEKFNKSGEYKIIIFYPGHAEGNDYLLFDQINDHHTYRASLLLTK